MIITHIYRLGTSGTFYYSGIGNFLEYCQGYHRSMALVVENHVRSQEDIAFGLVLVRLSVLAGQVLPMIEMILYGMIFMTLYKANKAPLGLSAEVCQTFVKITSDWTLRFFLFFSFFADYQIKKSEKRYHTHWPNDYFCHWIHLRLDHSIVPLSFKRSSYIWSPNLHDDRSHDDFGDNDLDFSGIATILFQSTLNELVENGVRKLGFKKMKRGKMNILEKIIIIISRKIFYFFTK